MGICSYDRRLEESEENDQGVERKSLVEPYPDYCHIRSLYRVEMRGVINNVASIEYVAAHNERASPSPRLRYSLPSNQSEKKAMRKLITIALA
jgi:hypothetical protein